jgi:hypothetical protein
MRVIDIDIGAIREVRMKRDSQEAPFAGDIDRDRRPGPSGIRKYLDLSGMNFEIEDSAVGCHPDRDRKRKPAAHEVDGVSRGNRRDGLRGGRAESQTEREAE